jgi:hypothetical protein
MTPEDVKKIKLPQWIPDNGKDIIRLMSPDDKPTAINPYFLWVGNNPYQRAPILYFNQKERKMQDKQPTITDVVEELDATSATLQCAAQIALDQDRAIRKLHCDMSVVINNGETMVAYEDRRKMHLKYTSNMTLNDLVRDIHSMFFNERAAAALQAELHKPFQRMFDEQNRLVFFFRGIDQLYPLLRVKSGTASKDAINDVAVGVIEHLLNVLRSNWIIKLLTKRYL